MARVRPRGARRDAVRHVRRPSANFERLHALVHGPPKFPGRGCRRRSTQHTQENDITDNVGRPHRRATARQRHSLPAAVPTRIFQRPKVLSPQRDPTRRYGHSRAVSPKKEGGDVGMRTKSVLLVSASQWPPDSLRESFGNTRSRDVPMRCHWTYLGFEGSRHHR